MACMHDQYQKDALFFKYREKKIIGPRWSCIVYVGYNKFGVCGSEHQKFVWIADHDVDLAVPDRRMPSRFVRIFSPTLCRITWYHWPTFFCFVLWHDDEATTEGGLCLGILRRQARVSRARFHVGSSIFASSSNTGMKSLEALNWELLPNPESVGALFTVSCMQASSRFLKIVTDHITSAQYQFVWCDLFWYNRLNVLLAKKKSSEFSTTFCWNQALYENFMATVHLIWATNNKISLFRE
jgi:hypothetical protein